MNNKPINIIFDGDPGHDDALAILLASASEKINILAITAVNGNCSVDKAAYNALRICALLNIKAPVAKGQNGPLYVKSLAAPSNIHGESGLDGPALPEPDRELESISAIELMIKTLEQTDDLVTIVATGPLTNVAALLLVRPDLKPKIERISIMGGGILYGNWTPAAEFNILVDPEAADIVFTSGIPIYMAPLDVTEKALILPQDVEEIKSLNNKVSDIVWQWLEFFYRFHKSIGYQGAPMHDPCAVMVLLHPEIFQLVDMHVDIETEGKYTYGATIGDINHITDKPNNATVLMNLDREAFVRYLVEAVRKFED